ncbi:hypothetical protein CLM85_26065, partial [Streptomyces albidoflavus]
TRNRAKGAAFGGLAAFIPSRRDAEVNKVAFAKVKDDKDREARDAPPLPRLPPGPGPGRGHGRGP